MWIVRLALRRPYTFIVAAILLLILGTLAIIRTPTDIFPNIDIPIVSVLWNYNGFSPEDMSDRIVYSYERSLTTTVNNIEHIESQSWDGRSIVKVFFQPGIDLGNAVAQVTAISQTAIHSMPFTLWADGASGGRMRNCTENSATSMIAKKKSGIEYSVNDTPSSRWSLSRLRRTPPAQQ